MGEMRQRLHHALHLGDLLFEISDVDERNFLHRRTLTAFVLPEFQQRLGLLQRETERARPLDEAQIVHVLLAIDPVIIAGAGGGGDEANLLVITDHLGGNARCFRCLADIHDVTSRWATFARFNLSALARTKTLDSAIAPAPIIGDSVMPKAG
ncbi:hypothetical protein D3C80_510210 [compost metagenome]